MRADALTQVPDADHASAITTDQLTLVGVNNDVVDRRTMNVVALKAAGTSVPDLDGTILGAGDHPFALTVECDASDVVGVALKGHDRVGVGGLDIVELDIVVACSSKESLIGSDAQAIDLGVGVLDSARTDAGQGLPEAEDRN